MARDDYFVLVYKILRHLYDCLKSGRDINHDVMRPGTKQFPIGEDYWDYIWRNLIEDGYIRGSHLPAVIDLDSTGFDLYGIEITPKGIQYLQENSMMKKAMKAIRTTRELIPHI